MQPIQHRTSNDVLQPPRGASREECRPLYITRFTYSDGDYGVMSVWQPSTEEIAQIVAGVPIMLIFNARTHPPVKVVVNGAL